MQQRYMMGGRYGVWGEPASTERMEAPIDPIAQALNTAKGVQGFFGDYYKNKLANIDSGLKQNQLDYSNRTLDSSIAAENTKNQTDTQYYPQIQAAKLQQEESTVKEIMARTGLNYAQAKMALAHIPLLQAQTQREHMLSNPMAQSMAQFDAAYSAYNNAPNGSPQKEYLGGVLNNFMQGGSLKTSKGSTGTAGSGMGLPMGESATGIQLNPMGGSNRSTFRQGYMPENNVDNPINQSDAGQTIESPTQASATQEQNRKVGHSEIEKLYPQVVSGLKPYQGPMGSGALVKDSALANMGNKEAQQRLDAYAAAKRFLPELASINARQATGREPGIELNREYESAMFPGLPGSAANWFIPSSSQEKANQTYLPLQGSAVEAAINQERGGFPQSGAPIWAQQPESQGGYFTSNGYVPRSQADPQSQKQNESGKKVSSQAEDSRTLNGVEYVKINGKWHTR